MTDEEFEDSCAEHPDLKFEMTEERELIVMAPTNSSIDASNAEASLQFANWAKTDRLRGLRLFDSRLDSYFGTEPGAR